MKLPYYLKVTDKVKYADSKLCRVRINPKYKDHKGLLAHEEEHIKQWYTAMIPLLIIAAITWFTYRQDLGLAIGVLAITAKDLAYTFIDKVRFKLEARGYRAQMKAMGSNNLEHYAKLLKENYDLDITIEEAREAIKG